MFTFHERYHQEDVEQKFYDDTLNAAQKFHLEARFVDVALDAKSFIWRGGDEKKHVSVSCDTLRLPCLSKSFPLSC